MFSFKEGSFILGLCTLMRQQQLQCSVLLTGSLHFRVDFIIPCVIARYVIKPLDIFVLQSKTMTVCNVLLHIYASVKSKTQTALRISSKTLNTKSTWVGWFQVDV